MKRFEADTNVVYVYQKTCGRRPMSIGTYARRLREDAQFFEYDGTYDDFHLFEAKVALRMVTTNDLKKRMWIE